MKTINIKTIRIDGGTQSRVEINNEIVTEYADAINSGAEFPSVVVFNDGVDNWLADGFHRFHAHNQAGKTSIAADVRQGTARDAVLYSLGANGTHGLNRTNADKRKAVTTMLSDAEWAKWSDSAIAKACMVDHKTVGAHRASILGNSQDAPTTRTVERNGKTYEQNTSNIGKSSPVDQSPVATPEPTPSKPVPVVEPESEIPEEESELDAVKGALSILNEENDRLNDKLAIAQLDATDEEKNAAHATILALRAENKTLTATNKALILSRDSLMEDVVQLKRQCQMQRKEIDKLKNTK